MPGLTDALRDIAAPPQETPDATLARWNRARHLTPPAPSDDMADLCLFYPVAAAVVGLIAAGAVIVTFAWVGWL